MQTRKASLVTILTSAALLMASTSAFADIPLKISDGVYNGDVTSIEIQGDDLIMTSQGFGNGLHVDGVAPVPGKAGTLTSYYRISLSSDQAGALQSFIDGQTGVKHGVILFSSSGDLSVVDQDTMNATPLSQFAKQWKKQQLATQDKDLSTTRIAGMCALYTLGTGSMEVVSWIDKGIALLNPSAQAAAVAQDPVVTGNLSEDMSDRCSETSGRVSDYVSGIKSAEYMPMMAVPTTGSSGSQGAAAN